jgi:hypothetical protein
MKIVESNSRLRAQINKALAKEGDKVLATAASRIQSRVREIVRVAIASCPEISSLSGGTLRLDFGLEEDPSSQIVNAIVGSVKVDVTNGGITINVQPSDFSNLLSLSIAQQPVRGGSIPWLSWLLTAGDSIIIADFGVEYSSGSGRTGGARMSQDFAPFRVDPRFSGNSQDNFITRAITPKFREISSIIRKELS